MRLKWPKSLGNYKAQFPKLSVFVGQKFILHHYCIQNVKDGIQIQIYKINNEGVTHFSQFISVKVKKILGKSQAQFLEKLRLLRLKQNDDFRIKTMHCIRHPLHYHKTRNPPYNSKSQRIARR